MTATAAEDAESYTQRRIRWRVTISTITAFQRKTYIQTLYRFATGATRAYTVFYAVLLVMTNTETLGMDGRIQSRHLFGKIWRNVA